MAKINFGKSDFQFSQLDEEFEPRIAIIFSQTDSRNFGIKTKLDLREAYRHPVDDRSLMQSRFSEEDNLIKNENPT